MKNRIWCEIKVMNLFLGEKFKMRNNCNNCKFPTEVRTLCCYIELDLRAGLLDFPWYNILKGEKYTERPKNFQKTENIQNDQKIYKMTETISKWPQNIFKS
jgi:hypothetical protein